MSTAQWLSWSYPAAATALSVFAPLGCIPKTSYFLLIHALLLCDTPPGAPIGAVCLTLRMMTGRPTRLAVGMQRPRRLGRHEARLLRQLMILRGSERTRGGDCAEAANANRRLNT